MSIFSRRFKYVTCKTWNAAAPGFVFPEVSNDNPDRQALLEYRRLFHPDVGTM